MISYDTNLVVYLYDGRDLARQQIARDILVRLKHQGAVVGLQVVGEVQNALRKRLKVSAQIAYTAASDLLTEFGSFAYGERAVAAALLEAAAGRLSYWDALLLAAADDVGVTTMISEDMRDGFKFRGLEVVNPFGPVGPSDRVRNLLAL